MLTSIGSHKVPMEKLIVIIESIPFFGKITFIIQSMTQNYFLGDVKTFLDKNITSKCLDQRSAHSSEGGNFDPDFSIML